MSEDLEKARRALASAQLLLDAGQLEGGANRAYYAFFHAAQAAVKHVARLDVAKIKSHNGLRRLFDAHVVQTGLVDRSVTTYFASVESARIVADYGSVPLQAAEVGASIAHAAAFIDACAKLLERPPS